ncbi:MAG TPA: DUF3159 domain-containing protein [Marmoricola sp.]|nr:DUF3159 domain-containing protein [Marmoricola sp.]
MTSASREEIEAEHTAEEFVRQHLAQALGGTRGMFEAGMPTAGFTVVFLTTHNLVAAIGAGAVMTAVALVVRIVQRTTVQYVFNAAFGIAIGAVFAYTAARSGGSVEDQALAYFLPGILLSIGYSIGLVFTVLVRWPLIGFLIGGVLGDPVGWHSKPGVVSVCNRLTLCLALPSICKVLIQGPLYLAGRERWFSPDVAVSALGVARLTMGWPLFIAAVALMGVLLSRGRTPLHHDDELVEVSEA